jgi:hypothetical protein
LVFSKGRKEEIKNIIILWTSRKPMMSGHGKSDSLIVPRKPPNKAQATEEVEGRRLAKGNLLEQNILRAQSQVGMHSALEWVRKADCYSLALSL